MVSSCEQLLCDLGPVIPSAAMAEPVNEPVFGAREDEMGIAFRAFKTLARQVSASRFSKRRMNRWFRMRSAWWA
ncbi:hypothetical protein ASG68_06225 [Rhizobium sp. Leaf453]|nr:hypothetical protein ASG42_13495 [Rhizobium sp. Leaf391]KQS94972.1 hypothetical protein ASG50_27445 [Rhizobium sp. Leaf386]KQU01348.1 hypothetical protein ASG68_06225 [Rhizobium sp. Leaf453]